MSIFDIICDYSNKNLPEVPENVLAMYNLKMLYLEGNLINSLPDNFFERLNKLTWLDLRKNKLTTIPAGIANHAFLETLLLQDNQIEELPDEMGVVPNLKVLQVSGNPLKYPEQQIISEGVNSVCNFLKQQFYKNNKTSINEDDEETELSVVGRNSSSMVTKCSEKPSVQELLHRSAKKRKSYGRILPVINVKSLSKTNSEEENSPPKNTSMYIVRASSAKKTHKITRSCSKISLYSHSQWNAKKKPILGDDERAQNEELKELWLKRLKELLADQERILQQEKNLKALSKWRLDKKMEAPRSSVETPFQPPFGTDPDSNRILSRKDLTDQIDKMIRKTKNNKKMQSGIKIDIQKLIGDVVDQMKNMESTLTRTSSKPASPRTNQEIATKQIETIMELHKKIMALQTTNNSNL